MAGHAKSTRKLGTKTKIAAFQFEDLATAIAAEVMMVRLAGDLVPKRLTGHRDRGEPVVLQQGPDIAVDGSDAQPTDLGLGGAQHLFRRERPVRTLKGFPNRSFLTCIARLSGQCSPSNTG